MVNLVELMHIVPLRELHQEKSLKCPTFFVKYVTMPGTLVLIVLL
jgi:hypothetical protein